MALEKRILRGTVKTFSLIALAPGDPAAIHAEDMKNPESYQAIRQMLV